MEVNNFILDNSEKVSRAINGVSFRHKGIVEKNGGLPKDHTPEQLLAEYDRLGGLILTKDNIKVKNGSFYDFEKKQPRKEPDIKFITNVDGDEIEVDEKEAKALKAAQKKIKEAKIKKIKKIKKLDK